MSSSQPVRGHQRALGFFSSCSIQLEPIRRHVSSIVKRQSWKRTYVLALDDGLELLQHRDSQYFAHIPLRDLHLALDHRADKLVCTTSLRVSTNPQRERVQSVPFSTSFSRIFMLMYCDMQSTNTYTASVSTLDHVGSCLSRRRYRCRTCACNGAAAQRSHWCWPGHWCWLRRAGAPATPQAAAPPDTRGNSVARSVPPACGSRARRAATAA